MRRWWLFVLALWAVAMAVAAPASATVRVYAASSLTEAMEAIADAYAATGAARPVLVFAGSSALARQIAAGAPASVFVSADTEWMDDIAAKRLIEKENRKVIATNRLVVVVPAGVSRKPLRIVKGVNFAGFVGDGKWVTGDPDSVPVGRYARAALTSLGAWDAAAPKLARAENVRAAMAFVERGEAAAGIVYATDARASAKVTVAGVFPAASHPPIVYPAALVAANADADARAFFRFLTGKQARAILVAKGFGAP